MSNAHEDGGEDMKMKNYICIYFLGEYEETKAVPAKNSKTAYRVSKKQEIQNQINHFGRHPKIINCEGQKLIPVKS